MDKRKNVEHFANRHHEAHLNLKERIHRYETGKENLFLAFAVTFGAVLISLLTIKSIAGSGLFKEKATAPPLVKTEEIEEKLNDQGARIGVVSTYRIDRQAFRVYENKIASLNTKGSFQAAKNNVHLGKEKKVSMNQGSGISDSIWLTHYMGAGRHLTTLQKQQTKILQKSLLTTYYIGEKTIDIDSAIQKDTRLIGQIQNALSVDLFQYLNQSVSRADALDSYLHLLSQLLNKTQERMNDLNTKVTFLDANSSSRNQEISQSEQQFFQQLNALNGMNAEEELKRFIDLRENQAEIRAKLGAYRSLYNYYSFFRPRLENLIREIQLNREALIAGVRVTEIQNMTLPLINR